MKYVLLDDENESGKEMSNSPGMQLRAAREKLNLDVKTVAKLLHINEESIIALEGDDYEKFPAPIYVIGFLRNYARLLNMVPEPLVKNYELLGKQAPPILSEVTAKIPRRRRRRLEPWTGYLAVGGVILMLLLWLFPSNKPLDDNPPVPANNQVQSITPLPAQEETQGTAPAPVVENKPPETAPGPPPAPIPADTLIVHFTGESWVEITDSTGRRVFYDTGKPGQTSTLLGTAPFSILLGYSPAVSIEYNGVPFDHSRYARQDVARFKLGKRN